MNIDMEGSVRMTQIDISPYDVTALKSKFIVLPRAHCFAALNIATTLQDFKIKKVIQSL